MIDEIEKCLRLMLEGTNYRKNRDFYEVDLNVIKNLIKECECMKLNVKNIKDDKCRYFIKIWKSNNKSSEKQTKNKKKTINSKDIDKSKKISKSL